MKIIFLPGMDGTGLLFEGLVRQIPLHIDREVVCLNDLPGVSYREQAECIAQGLGSADVVLVAESYSGRIAYELCGILGSRVLKVVFIASFVSCPSRLARLAGLLPEFMLKPQFFPDWFLRRVGFSGPVDSDVLDQVRQAASQAGAKTLKQRLASIAELNVPKNSYDIEAVYIKPSDDRLVSGDVVSVLGEVFPKLKIETVEGGHFIAQSKPVLCANIIIRLLSRQ